MNREDGCFYILMFSERSEILICMRGVKKIIKIIEATLIVFKKQMPSVDVSR